MKVKKVWASTSAVIAGDWSIRNIHSPGSTLDTALAPTCLFYEGQKELDPEHVNVKEWGIRATRQNSSRTL